MSWRGCGTTRVAAMQWVVLCSSRMVSCIGWLGVCNSRKPWRHHDRAGESHCRSRSCTMSVCGRVLRVLPLRHTILWPQHCLPRRQVPSLSDSNGGHVTLAFEHASSAWPPGRPGLPPTHLPPLPSPHINPSTPSSCTHTTSSSDQHNEVFRGRCSVRAAGSGRVSAGVQAE
jgi:hypothetical protein